MNKSDLVKVFSKEMDLPIRKAEEIVDKVFDTMSSALIAGDRIGRIPEALRIRWAIRPGPCGDCVSLPERGIKRLARRN